MQIFTRNSRQAALLFFLISIGLLVLPPAAHAENKCIPAYKRLARYLRINFKHYTRDVARTRGLRLLLRNTPNKEPETRLLGFLTEYERPKNLRWYRQIPSRTLQAIPRKLSFLAYGKEFDFRPVHGVVYNVVTRPVRAATRWAFGRQKDFSLWISMPAGFATFIYGYDKADQYYKNKLVENVLEGIEDDAAVYDWMIEYDFRYHDIKLGLARGNLTPKDARAEVYIRSHFLKQYFEYMHRSYSTASWEENVQFLFGLPQFFHLRKLVLDGIPQSRSFIYGENFDPELSDQQTKDLVDANHMLQTAMDILPTIAKGGEELERLQKDPEAAELVKSVQEDPFAKFLFGLHRKGLLTRDELSYRLQEDAFWQTRFKEQEILHIAKRKVAADGSLSDIPLTLDDVRQEAIDEIKTAHKAKLAQDRNPH